MLKTKWLMLTLSTSLLITTPVKGSITPFQPTTEQSIENKIDNNGMVNKKDLGFQNPIIKKLEKDRIEFEQKKIEKQIEEQKNNNIEWKEFIVSFYTGLEEENSIYGNVNCKHLPLERGMIANNILPYGTKIYLDNDFGIRTVEDTGSKIFNSSNRIDLYVARYDGETKEQWKRRAESYGIRYIWGYIIK